MASLLSALKAQRCHPGSRSLTSQAWLAVSGAGAGFTEAGLFSASLVSGHGHKFGNVINNQPTVCR